MKRRFPILALRNLARYRTRNLLTATSIALGAAAIILGLSLTNGMIRQTIKGFTGTRIEDIMIFPENSRVLANSDKIKEAVSDIGGVDYVTEKVSFRAVVFSGTTSLNALVVGMERDDARRQLNLQIEKGEYLDPGDPLSLIISKKLSRRLQVATGDKLALVVNTPQGGTNATDFNVKGIFTVKTGLQFVDHLIYVNLDDARSLMGLGEKDIFGIGMYIREVDAVDGIEKRTKEVLVGQGLSCHVRSWKWAMKGFLSQYYVIKYIVLVFTIILLLIVCTGVVNAVFLSVSERTREIGTMMALGARRRKIAFLFMLEAGFLSCLSAAFGVLIGVSLTLLFQKIDLAASSRAMMWVFGGKHLCPYLSVSTVLFSFCFVVLMTVIGMSYPIFKACRMEPTKALGYV